MNASVGKFELCIHGIFYIRLVCQQSVVVQIQKYKFMIIIIPHILKFCHVFRDLGMFGFFDYVTIFMTGTDVGGT